MANTVDSTYMGMPIPQVGIDPGPRYAFDLVSCIETMDSHDHSAGKGIQLMTSGININAALTFDSNNAIALRTSKFTPQTLPISVSTDVGCIYVSGADLYYNNTTAQQIRITASGSIAGNSGSVSGLVAPASITYNSGSATYIFQSDVSVPGTLDGGSLILRDLVSNSNGVTLSAHAALAADFTMKFPAALPGSTKIMSLGSGGVIGDSYDVDNSTLQILSNVMAVKDSGIVTAKINDSAVTNVKLAATTCAFANVTGSTNSTSYVDFSSGGITITATNKFIEIGLVINAGTEGYIFAAKDDVTIGAAGAIRIKRSDGVSWGFPIGGNRLSGLNVFVYDFFPPESFFVIDNSVVASTSYTYTVEAHTAAITYNIAAVNISMYVKEIP